MKKAILTTFICSVIAVGVALSGYVIYDKLLKNEDNNPENKQDEKTYFNSNRLSESAYTFKYQRYDGDENSATAYGDVSKYSNIFEYLADMKLESIKLEYATKEVKEETIIETIFHRDTYTLTKNEANEFLNEMKSSTQKFVGGFGGSHNVSYVYVSYKINGKIQTTKLDVGMWMLNETTDGNIYKIIDNNIPQKDYDVLLVSDKNSDVIANIINRLNN